MPQTSTPSLILRPADQRFHTQLDWLESWHSFSFAGHHDPTWMGFGPLRVINDDTIAAGRGFGMHPHNDMEIVTVMVEGELSHADSMGHSAVLRAGEVQRMSAGTGIVHSEINRSDRSCRLLQIWIEPERIGIDPAYEQQPFSIGADWTPLIDPAGTSGAMATAGNSRIWRARPQQQEPLPLPSDVEPAAVPPLDSEPPPSVSPPPLLVPESPQPTASARPRGIGLRIPPPTRRRARSRSSSPRGRTPTRGPTASR